MMKLEPLCPRSGSADVVDTALSLRGVRGAPAGPALDRAELDRRWDLSGLVGEDPPRLLPALARVLRSPRPRPRSNPLWDGRAARRVVADWIATYG